jgi:hypothetical protein
MSTTLVTQLSGEGGIDMTYQRFLVVTVREDGAEKALKNALGSVSQDSLWDTSNEEGEPILDEVEMRASISSELRARALQLVGLQVCGFGWLGE